MHAKTALSLVILLCTVLAIAGCTGAPGAAPAATQAPAATAAPSSGAPAAVATPAGGSLEPSPTDVVVASRTLTLNVEKDYLGNVVVTFQGGNGNGHVKSFDVTVNRADGQVSTGKLGVNIGDVVTLTGTKDADRVIVVANMDDGKAYKVIDMTSKFRTIG
jgi:hypothetical protein